MLSKSSQVPSKVTATENCRSGPEVVKILSNLSASIVDGISLPAVAAYENIRRMLTSGCEASRDHFFQFVYSSFYGLRTEIADKSFRRVYFETFDEVQREPSTPLLNILERLRLAHSSFPNGKLHFSFATKIVATINPDLAPYDQLVGSVYAFRPKYNIKDFAIRQKRMLEFYDYLQRTNREIASDPVVEQLDGELKSKIPSWNGFTMMKRLDFILWTAGGLNPDVV